MNQKSLDNWLENVPTCKIKHVMYLDWSSRKPNNVEWLDYIPCNATHFTTIHWNELDKSILVCGKIKTGIVYDNIEEKYSNVFFSKVSFTKNVYEKATKTMR